MNGGVNLVCGPLSDGAESETQSRPFGTKLKASSRGIGHTSVDYRLAGGAERHRSHGNRDRLMEDVVDDRSLSAGDEERDPGRIEMLSEI